MPSLFISYRRNDSTEIARQIRDCLESCLPHWKVFFDEDDIVPGDPLPERLRHEVTHATAVLAVIGANWLKMLQQREQERPHGDGYTDHVIAEINIALTAKRHVIPVLVDGASMPTEVELRNCPGLEGFHERRAFSIDLSSIAGQVNKLAGHVSDLDPLSRDVREIQDLIAAYQMDDAIKRLLDLARAYHRRSEQTAVILSGRHTLNKKTALLHPGPDAQREAVYIMNAALELAKEIAQHGGAPLSPIERSWPDRDLVVRTRQLHKVRRAENPHFELNEVSLDIRLREITAVVGPNGQGKTTLLEILAGCLRHDSGELDYPAICGPQRHWPTIKAAISYVRFPSPNLQGTAERYLRFAAATHGARGKDNDREVDRIVERLGLAEYRRTPVNELSSGYRARVGIAAALLKKPKLLVIDEPLANLDKHVQPQLLSDLRNLSRIESESFAAVLSSQHIHEIESIADRILFLANGRPRFYGPATAIRSDRTKESYEVQGDLDVGVLRGILPHGWHANLQGPSVIVHTPRGTRLDQLVALLASHQVRVRLVRDIGGSPTMFFEEVA